MKALIYLIKRTAANNLKKAVRKPTTLLALIFGAAYGIFLIVMLGTLAVTVRIDSVQGLVILVTVWTIYITVGKIRSTMQADIKTLQRSLPLKMRTARRNAVTDRQKNSSRR